MKLMLLAFTLTAALYGQKVNVDTLGYDRVAQLNHASFVQTGTGAPTAAACNVPGLDQYFDTATTRWYTCTAAGAPGTWALNAGGSSASLDREWAPAMDGPIACKGPLSRPAVGYPSLQAFTGSNRTFCTWNFDQGLAESLSGQVTMPAASTALTMEVSRQSSDATPTHTVVWSVSGACSAVSNDPSMTAIGTTTGTVGAAVAPAKVKDTIALTVSCAAGDEFYFSLVNSSGTATDLEVSNIRLHN